MASIRSTLYSKLDKADKLAAEDKVEEAFKLYSEIINNSKEAPEVKILALQHRGKYYAEFYEDFDKGCNDYLLALQTLNNSTDISFVARCKPLLIQALLRANMRAMIVLEEQKEIDCYKQKTEKILSEHNKLFLHDSWFRRYRHDIFLLHDLCNESKSSDLISTPILTENTPLLNFILYSLKGSDKALLKFAECVDWIKDNPIDSYTVRLFRRQFISVMMKPCFFDKHPHLDTKGLDALKNEILKFLPSLKSELRIRAKIHALCKRTLLGYVFHSATGPLKPSLKKTGKLRDIATSLLMEPKIETDSELRALLDRDKELETELRVYLPELARKLYFEPKFHFFKFELDRFERPISSINDQNEGNSFIRNAVL